MTLGIDKQLTLRTRRINRRQRRRGRDFVLCWLQQALRAEHNPVLDVAIREANELGLPVVVYHGLGNRYPHASWRLHQFILEASKDLGPAVRERGLRFVRFVEGADGDGRGLLVRLASRAACVVTDDQAAFVGRWQAESLAKSVDVALFAVDAAGLVPGSVFDAGITSVWKFKAAHQPQRQRFGLPKRAAEPERPAYDGDLPLEHRSLRRVGAQRMRRLARDCGVDMSLPPAQRWSGSRGNALSFLERAVREVLPSYAWRRNNPADPTSASLLSPYLHFGVLSPQEIKNTIDAADIHGKSRWKFYDELLGWREFFHHQARHLKDPTAFSNLPDAALQTLAEHAGDEREDLYSLAALVHGETSDETWNAAQKQYLYEGYMHNNLRMYWGKRLLAWCETPELAWRTACYLNDRFSLDGRDPATYGNLQWCFGRSKKARQETEIYGWVPRKSDAALRKREGVPEWIATQAARDDYRVAVPEAI